MNKNKGITLITLVITVIVLLILSGTTIAIISSSDNLFQQTKNAGSKSVESTKQEAKSISSLIASLNDQETVFNGVKIPAGFSPTGIEGETTVDEGLVIIDSDGNEYVWIEVPNDGSGPDYTGVETNNVIDTSKIYTSLQNYCKKDVNGNDLVKSEMIDEWMDSSGKTASTSANLNDTATCGLTSLQYQELLDKMLISVYTNGGFWIGRYEAGMTTVRADKDEPIDGIKVYSKPNMYPINCVLRSQAQTLAATVAAGTQYSSSVLFGIQWDLALRFFNNKGIDSLLLTTDSSSLGNYTNTSFVVDRGEYSAAKPWNEFVSYKLPSDNGKITVVNGITTKNRLP